MRLTIHYKITQSFSREWIKCVVTSLSCLIRSQVSLTGLWLQCMRDMAVWRPEIVQCNLEIHLISKFLKTMTVWHPFWRLLLGSAFWELMLLLGTASSPFYFCFLNSCNIFSHLLTLAHALSHTALIVTPWLPFIHYHLTLGLNTLASPNVTTPQTTRKHAWPKPNGPQLKRQLW